MPGLFLCLVFSQNTGHEKDLIPELIDSNIQIAFQSCILFPFPEFTLENNASFILLQIK